MPKIDRIPEGLLLAAVKRADLHQGSDRTGVPHWKVAEHLAFRHTSWTTRRLRPQLEALYAAGMLEQSRHRGIALWQLTGKGRRRALPFAELPESPHRQWREARALAAQEIERFHLDLRDAVEGATDLLDEPVVPGPASAAWFEMGKRLERACWRLGSATYCLHEWAEPDDAHADIDEPGGRRNTRLWRR
jgi:hypothetical protein